MVLFIICCSRILILLKICYPGMDWYIALIKTQRVCLLLPNNFLIARYQENMWRLFGAIWNRMKERLLRMLGAIGVSEKCSMPILKVNMVNMLLLIIKCWKDFIMLRL